MILMGSELLVGRLFVYAVTLTSLILIWEVVPSLPKIWFGSSRDPGITIYLLVVACWFYMQLPVRHLAPIFFADPAGAVVGRFMSKNFPHFNPRWIGEKTVCGSAAVFAVTALTTTSYFRLTLAAVATIGEAVGGRFDNLLIAVSVVSFLIFE